MLKAKHKRLLIILALILLTSTGIAIVGYSMYDSIIYFKKPSELQASVNQQKTAGYVKNPTMDNLTNTFYLTDNTKEIKVVYVGLLPPMFREKQGIVAFGVFDGNTFTATKLLTKHDERYTPPELK
jgi:cytochrome c-type biogenesis protein CcmE